MAMDDKQGRCESADDDGARRVAGKRRDRKRNRSGDRARGDEPCDENGCQKDNHGDRGRRRREHREDSCGCSDAFAASESNPDRIDVTDDGGQTRGHDNDKIVREQPGRDNSHSALGNIQEHNRDGRDDAGGAKDVGRSHVVTAFTAHIHSTRSREQKRERNCSEQISESDGNGYSHGMRSSAVYAGPLGDNLL